MPRSSRHKSESKHSSRDNREPSESEEDVKMKGSVRVSKDSASSEKRKLSSSKVSSGYSNGDASEDYVGSKRRKEKPDGNAAASDRWNGGEDEVCDVVTVDKAIKGENLKTEAVKSLKSKALVDLKSKISRRNDSGSEKKLEDVVLKEEGSRTSSRVESKRKSEKDTAKKEVRDEKDSKESREKERSTGRERKIHGSKHESEAEIEVASKDLGEERKGKRSRENTETSAQGELQNSEEKELGKRTRRRRDGSNDREKDNKDSKSQGYVKESGDIRLSSKAERIKDGRYKDVKHGEKHNEDIEDVKDSEAALLSSKGERSKDGRYKDVKNEERPREDIEEVKESEDIRLSSKAERTKDGRYKDVKHGEKPREDIEDVKESEDTRLSSKAERTKDGRYKDVKQGEKPREDIKDVKVSEDTRLSSKAEHVKDGRYKDVKHGEKPREGIKDANDSEDARISSKGESTKDGRYKDVKHGEKYREDIEDVKESEDIQPSSKGEHTKDARYKDVKHGEKQPEDVGKDASRDYKYREDSERYGRHRDGKYGDRNSKPKDDKYHEKAERDDKHRDDKHREDGDRRRADKYHEDGDKAYRHRGDRYRDDGDRRDRRRDDGDRDDRRRDDQYPEDGNRDARKKEDKNRDEVGRDGGHRDDKPRNVFDKDKRLQDAKYRDERSSRDPSDKPDTKSSRDESNAAEPHFRKSSIHDASQTYDDRRSRYNDDKGRRRTGDREDHNDMRSRSTAEQPSDAAKFSMSSGRTDPVSDRGRSRALHSDIEMNHSRRRSSPSAGPHSVKDQNRNMKSEESKSRDYASEERYRHYATSRKDLSGSTRPIEKSFQKDDSHLRELSERRSKADSRRSPSSTSAERRHLNRSDVKRSLDIDNSGQRDGGSKDGKDYSSRDGKGSREFHKETVPGDEFAQADGDNLSVSSPFGRPGGHLSGNSRSYLLPSPHFRTDSPLPLGSFEEDNRGKSIYNRHRRNSDPNMGRLSGNAWRGVPNWPSPVANGFLPFQHGPPPVGFHPMMQPFPTPMFGVRPSMELNPQGFPYHVSDVDRYSGHGRPLGWHNPADDSCGPAIHGWDGNNLGFRDESSHNYGRSNWDHKRSLSGGDTWMGQIHGGTELASSHQKDDYSSLRGADEPWTAQSDMKEESGKKQLDGNIDIDQSGKSPERNDLGSPEIVPDEVADILSKDNACPSLVYLSTLDVSEDLTHPEVFSEFTSLVGIDQKTGYDDGDDSKMFLVEEFVGPALKKASAASSASLFPAIDDSICQKAMSLYKKLRDETRNCREGGKGGKNLEAGVEINLGQDGQEETTTEGGVEEEEGSLAISNAMKMETSPQGSPMKIDDEPAVEASNMEKLVVEPAGEAAKMELDTVTKVMNVEESSSPDYYKVVVEKSSSYPDISDKIAVLSPGGGGNVGGCDDIKVENIVMDEQEKFGGLPPLISGVSSSTSVTTTSSAMAELVEPGSVVVNLSRIHHQSPAESTH